MGLPAVAARRLPLYLARIHRHQPASKRSASSIYTLRPTRSYWFAVGGYRRLSPRTGSAVHAGGRLHQESAIPGHESAHSTTPAFPLIPPDSFPAGFVTNGAKAGAVQQLEYAASGVQLVTRPKRRAGTDVLINR